MTRRSKEDVLAALEENLPKPVKVVKEIVLKTADSDQIVDAAETDVQYSRDKLKELIDLSSEAIQNMMALASETIKNKEGVKQQTILFSLDQLKNSKSF